MTLTLRAVSLNELPLTQKIAAHFDRRGGTIGRAEHNTLALPDPERHISRQQAELSADWSGYVISNVGANPIMLGKQALARGESAPLSHGDKVRIGGYLLEVVDDSVCGADDDVETVVPGRAPIAAHNGTRQRVPLDASESAGAASGAGLEAWGPLSRDNPFAELLGDAQANVHGAHADLVPSRVETPARLPTDFDPFAPRPPAHSTTDAGPREAGTFADLFPDDGLPAIDDLIDTQPGDSADLVADFLREEPPHRSRRDALKLAPPPERGSDHVPELHAAYKPPMPSPRQNPPLQARVSAVPSPVAKPPAPMPAPTPCATIDDAPTRPSARLDDDRAAVAWAAFCDAAGVKIDAPNGLDPDLMRVVGGLLRVAVEGTLQLMALRATTRHELHAQVTTIRPRGNNPLKFSPDASAALERLLQPPSRGFMPAPAAMIDAMNDLVGHAIGTMAGTRAALEGVLGRFAPKELEAKLVGSSMLDSVLPVTRKARLWELYLQHYGSIRDEAQEDFHALFGKAFLAAYEQQLDRLHRRESSPAA